MFEGRAAFGETRFLDRGHDALPLDLSALSFVISAFLGIVGR